MMISCLALFWWPFFTVYNCSPYSITKHLEMICLWRRCAMWRLLIYLLIPGHWWWTGTTIYYYLIIVVKLVVDTGLSMTNWIYYSTFHLELMCGLFLVYRVDAISRTYGTKFFIFMSAIEDVMLPRLLYNKHIPYVEQVNKRASYNLNNLWRDNRLFRTKIDIWVNHC